MIDYNLALRKWFSMNILKCIYFCGGIKFEW